MLQSWGHRLTGHTQKGVGMSFLFQRLEEDSNTAACMQCMLRLHRSIVV